MRKGASEGVRISKISARWANLVTGIKWLQNAYTSKFNVRRSQWGCLFEDRYKWDIMVGDDYFYETLMDSIHLNTTRAGLINPAAGKG